MPTMIFIILNILTYCKSSTSYIYVIDSDFQYTVGMVT